MKKLLPLVLAAALLLTIAACGKPYAPMPNPPLVLGEKYLTDLDYEQAILQFDQAIQIDPKNPRGWLGKADALLHLERQDEAVQALADGAKATSGETRAALKTAQAEVEKSSVDGYIGLSFAYEKLGWREIAIALLKRVCAELPEEGRLREALEGLEGVIDISQNKENQKQGLGTRTERRDHADGSYYIEQYNEQGQNIRTDFYSADGQKTHFFVFQHNEKGQETRGDHYDTDSVKRGYWTYLYDEQGCLMRRDFYDSNGIKTGFWTYRYDEQRERLLGENYYDVDGTLTGYNAWQENGELFHYDPDGTKREFN